MEEVTKLSRRTKFAYGIGQVGEQVKTRGFDLFVFFYFQQVLGLSGTLAGAAVAIALVVDAVTDPIAGALSDRWASPRGRRHPFMYASAAPLGLFWFLLFFPPSGLGQWGLFGWLTCFAILVRAAMTLYHVPHIALGAELTSDYEERTAVVAWRNLAGMVGGVGTAVIGYSFFPESEEYGNALLNPAGYPRVALFGSVVMVVTIWYSAWGTRDQIPRLAAAPPASEAISIGGIAREYRKAWQNPSFRGLFIGFAVFAISFGVTQTLGPHINVFFWEFSKTQLQILPLPFALGFVVGVVGSARLHARYDKKACMIGSSVVAVVLGNLAIVLRFLGLFPDNHSPALLPTVACLLLFLAVGAGVAFTSAASMMADVAQEFELETGKPQEGILFSAVSFSGKLASGAGHVIGGIGIDLIAFPVMVKDPGSVAPELIRNLGLLNLTAAMIGATGIYFYHHYRISRESHTATLASLAERQQAAAE